MRFLIWLLIGYLAYRMLRGKPKAEIENSRAAAETHQDPVCGVYVSEEDAVVGNLAGKRIYFCSIGCLEQFQKDQQRS